MLIGRRRLLTLAAGGALSTLVAPSSALELGKPATDDECARATLTAWNAPSTTSVLLGIKSMAILLLGFEKHVDDGGYTQSAVHDKIEARLRSVKITVCSSLADVQSSRRTAFCVSLNEFSSGGNIVFSAEIKVMELVYSLELPGRREVAGTYYDSFLGIAPGTILPDSFGTGLDSAMDRFLIQYAKDNA